jgi:hypothetical protein
MIMEEAAGVAGDKRTYKGYLIPQLARTARRLSRGSHIPALLPDSLVQPTSVVGREARLMYLLVLNDLRIGPDVVGLRCGQVIRRERLCDPTFRKILRAVCLMVVGTDNLPKLVACPVGDP